MGGVNIVDQHLAEYATPRKLGKKYYKKIFFHCLKLALWNSYIIYTKMGGTKYHLDFHLSIVNKIMKKYHQEVMPPQVGANPL